jgi:hypothetical protein
MNVPYFVLPNHCDPGFQYTPESVLTHTSFLVAFGAVFLGGVSVVTTFGASSGSLVAATGRLAPMNL